MSRPLFSAFRAAFRAGGAPFGSRAAPRSTFNFTAGLGAGAGFTFGARHASSTVVSTSMRSTLFRPITILLAFAPILCGYLGVWQVQRLKWKLALIDEIDHNLTKAPIALPSHVNMSALPDFAFRRVLLKGHFRGPPILQGPQTRDGTAGYHLIVPFDRSAEGGSTVLVNQGFILTAEGDAIREGRKPVPGLAADGGPGEEVVIEAMLTKVDNDAKSYFVPPNQPHDNQWFWKDIPDMAEWVGGEAAGVQPVLVDVIDHGDSGVPASMRMAKGVPVGRPPTIELRNQHMTYVITWFSLCAATTVMLGLVIRSGRTKKIPKRRPFGRG
ncbi:hypothetical protein CspHIS471_0411310 [Cutaneotrichosporon sp. HIS471]|nr:hypothetical protein CspHIS471_0411310 [Cutaneotrichosporon sp. HIS471]